ncbi:MAG: transglutaminase, partial [Betaproteobacteria bacterium]
MNRRNFLKTSALAAAIAMPAVTRAADAAVPAATSAPGVSFPPFAPTPDTGWRRFEVSSRIEPSPAEGVIRAWVPLPSMDQADWFRPMGNLWQGNAETTRVVRDAASGAQMLYAEWAASTGAPVLEVVSRVATRDRATDFTRPAPKPLALSASERKL